MGNGSALATLLRAVIGMCAVLMQCKDKPDAQEFTSLNSSRMRRLVVKNSFVTTGFDLVS